VQLTVMMLLICLNVHSSYHWNLQNLVAFRSVGIWGLQPPQLTVSVAELQKGEKAVVGILRMIPV